MRLKSMWKFEDLTRICEERNRFTVLFDKALARYCAPSDVILFDWMSSVSIFCVEK